jgi:hypothetical protein
MTALGSAEVVKLARWPPFEMAPAPSDLLFGGFGIPASSAPSVCGDSAFAKQGTATNETPIKHGTRMARSLFMAVSFDWSHASQSGPLKLAVPWPYTKLSDKLAPVARGYKNGKMGFSWFHRVRHVNSTDE